MNTFCAASLNAVSAALLANAPVLADDWIATQLRGQALQLGDNQWQLLKREQSFPTAESSARLDRGMWCSPGG